MNLNQLRDEVHQNAKDHGWWEEERTFGEIIALCHSELSEALEEYRNGHLTNAIFLSGSGGFEKPEGIPIELADCIIRILDYYGKELIDIDKCSQFMIARKYDTFGDFIALAHLYLSKAFEHNSVSPLKGLIIEIQDYCSKNNINIEEAIRIKHEYNKTRPFRHGGKKI